MQQVCTHPGTNLLLFASICLAGSLIVVLTTTTHIFNLLGESK
jgi:hypothetical protein